jgi:hypothetical protein
MQKKEGGTLNQSFDFYNPSSRGKLQKSNVRNYSGASSG